MAEATRLNEQIREQLGSNRRKDDGEEWKEDDVANNEEDGVRKEEICPEGIGQWKEGRRGQGEGRVNEGRKREEGGGGWLDGWME